MLCLGSSVVPRRIRRRPGRCVVSDGHLHSTVQWCKTHVPELWDKEHVATIKSRPEPDGLHHLGHPGEGDVCNTTQQHRRSEAGPRDGMVEFRRGHRAALAPLRRGRFRGRSEDQRWPYWFIVPLLRCVHATEYVYQKSFEYLRSGPKYFQKSRGKSFCPTLYIIRRGLTRRMRWYIDLCIPVYTGLWMYHCRSSGTIFKLFSKN